MDIQTITYQPTSNHQWLRFETTGESLEFETYQQFPDDLYRKARILLEGDQFPKKFYMSFSDTVERKHFQWLQGDVFRDTDIQTTLSIRSNSSLTIRVMIDDIWQPVLDVLGRKHPTEIAALITKTVPNWRVALVEGVYTWYQPL